MQVSLDGDGREQPDERQNLCAADVVLPRVVVVVTVGGQEQQEEVFPLKARPVIVSTTPYILTYLPTNL